MAKNRAKLLIDRKSICEFARSLCLEYPVRNDGIIPCSIRKRAIANSKWTRIDEPKIRPIESIRF